MLQLSVLHQVFAFSFFSPLPLSTSSFVISLTSSYHISYFLELASVFDRLYWSCLIFLVIVEVPASILTVFMES